MSFPNLSKHESRPWQKLSVSPCYFHILADFTADVICKVVCPLVTMSPFSLCFLRKGDCTVCRGICHFPSHHPKWLQSVVWLRGVKDPELLWSCMFLENGCTDRRKPKLVPPLRGRKELIHTTLEKPHTRQYQGTCFCNFSNCSYRKKALFCSVLLRYDWTVFPEACS